MIGFQQYGDCAVCGRRLCLRGDGTVRVHRAVNVTVGLWPRCPGSLMPPGKEARRG